MNQEEKKFQTATGVTYETIHRLTLYKNLLTAKNEIINLVAKSTLSQLWTRHFLDSAQLWPHIPETAKIAVDMGAGAGFPGLVLAIIAKQEKRLLHFIEIESIGKKADFLEEVVKRLQLDVTVRRDRIETIKDIKADIITARALKALPELFNYAQRLKKHDTLCLFLKGKSVDEELTEAKKYWTFKAKAHQSQSDDSGRLLVIKDLQYISRR